MGNITIECKGIKKTFTSGNEVYKILEDINLVTYENQIVMIMGSSGSGKSTLLNIIGGILQQDSGSCLILGKSMQTMPEKEKTVFRGKNMGFVFQRINLVATLTALENVAILLMIHGVAREIAFKRSRELLSSFGLRDRLNNFPQELSGGEQQRVAIARACIDKPQIIICDEPTSALDLERGKKIMDILQGIKHEQRGTILVVTHDPRIVKYADAIFNIEEGHIKKVPI